MGENNRKKDISEKTILFIVLKTSLSKITGSEFYEIQHQHV